MDDVALDIDESEELSWMVVEQISADGPLEQVAVSVNLYLTKHRDNQNPHDHLPLTATASVGSPLRRPTWEGRRPTGHGWITQGGC